jgi:mRNA-degrading endonuclease RelE of RelBE toxin-antitoxin system
MPRKLQLELLDGFQLLPSDFENADEKFGQLMRGGKRVYRYRVGDYRIYFDKAGDIVRIQCILHKNTLKDFFYRTKLPISEDKLLQENPKFWELIEDTQRR